MIRIIRAKNKALYIAWRQNLWMPIIFSLALGIFFSVNISGGPARCHTLCQVLPCFEGAHSLVRWRRDRAIRVLPETSYGERRAKGWGSTKEQEPSLQGLRRWHSHWVSKPKDFSKLWCMKSFQGRECKGMKAWELSTPRWMAGVQKYYYSVRDGSIQGRRLARPPGEGQRAIPEA